MDFLTYSYCAEHQVYGFPGVPQDRCHRINYENGLQISLVYVSGPNSAISVIAANLDGPYDPSGRFDPAQGHYAYHAGVMLISGNTGTEVRYFNGVTQPSVTLTINGGNTGELTARMLPPGLNQCLTSRTRIQLDGDAVKHQAIIIIRGVIESLLRERSSYRRSVASDALSVLDGFGL